MKKLSLILMVMIMFTFIWLSNNQKELSIYSVNTDKAMYKGEEVNLLIEVENKKLSTGIVNFEVDVYHIEELIESFDYEVTLTGSKYETVNISWTPPVDDFKGYLVKVSYGDEVGTVGVDVSSSWTKFPRYGYLHDFKEYVPTSKLIDEMNAFHINVIEYYDWHYRHHQPVPNNLEEWDDWSGRIINGKTLEDYIEDARSKNMTNMAYNMIYAATNDFFDDESKNEMKIQLSSGKDFKYFMAESPNGNDTLYFMNPLNTDWQTHIFGEMKKAIDVFGFDGWHGDTIGDHGRVTSNGEALGLVDNKEVYSVLDTYLPFLNKAKEKLGDAYLTFNPVGAKGIIDVNKSDVDALYTEFWPWDEDRFNRKYNVYNTIVSEINKSFDDSRSNTDDGEGKSLVVKAYINYDKTSGYMNEPAVLLMDAFTFAAGGSRLEVGNGSNMLHTEYYPDDQVQMSIDLRDKVITYYDFMVAYENILRDGQQVIKRDVSSTNYSLSETAQGDSISFINKEDEQYEILHLINLLGTDNLWRDAAGTKLKPEIANNISINYETENEIKEVYLVSPDLNNGVPTLIDFKKDNNTYKLVVPSLEYWDTLLFVKE